MLSHAALTDVGLDNLSAAFLQNHLHLRYGVRIEKNMLLQHRLSILQLAHGIASTLAASESRGERAQKRALAGSREIEAKLLKILEGAMLPSRTCELLPPIYFSQIDLNPNCHSANRKELTYICQEQVAQALNLPCEGIQHELSIMHLFSRMCRRHAECP